MENALGYSGLVTNLRGDAGDEPACSRAVSHISPGACRDAFGNQSLDDAIHPDGRELPPGSGIAADGAKVYAASARRAMEKPVPKDPMTNSSAGRERSTPRNR